uniref:Calcineurin-like phosphoesterase domain-containing protein n=1 Tax=Attheya septentrionalis TaxID=420275 RepID=A0A7S2U6K6_9STRA
METQIGNLTNSFTNDAAKFLIHVGDIQSGQTSMCRESFYKQAYDIFLQQSPLPTMMLAGDNDWNACPKAKDGWRKYASYFIGLEKSWAAHKTLGVKRWNDVRPENFVFSISGVLIVSVNLVGTPILDRNEWDQRNADNVFWVKKGVADYLKNDQGELRAVMVLGHAMMRPTIVSFFQGIREIFMTNDGGYKEGFQIPVIYLHGDGHKFAITNTAGVNGHKSKARQKFVKDLDWDQFTDIQVDKGQLAPPIKIEVAGVKDPLLEVHNIDQYVLGDGLIRIDRRGGHYQTKMKKKLPKKKKKK